MKIKKINQSAGLIANVVDNLNSTSSTDALSANQGTVLKNDSLRQCTIPTTIIGTNLGWYLVCTGVIPEEWAYQNYQFVLLISQIFNGESGILNINIRRDADVVSVQQFEWLCNTGLSSAHFKLKIDGLTFRLYANVVYEYNRYNIRVLQEHTLEPYNNDLKHNLFEFNEPLCTDVLSEEPDGVYPTDSWIKGTITANEGFSLTEGRWSLVKDPQTKMVYLDVFVTSSTALTAGGNCTPFTIPEEFCPKSTYVNGACGLENPYGTGSWCITDTGIMNVRPDAASTKIGMSVCWLGK